MTVVSASALTDFLLARFADDEADARDAGGLYWRVNAQGCCVVEAEGDGWMDNIETHNNGTAPHIARHDPARVLAECEAKRRIVELHKTITAAYPGRRRPCCVQCSAGGEYPGKFPCETARLLAAPYADHPDYDPRWAPDTD